MTIFNVIEKYGLHRPESVFQVGASGGQELDDFKQNGIKFGVFVEPLDFPCSVLAARCEGIQNYVPIKALATSHDGEEVLFHVASNGGMSSSMFAPEEHLRIFPEVTFAEQQSMVGHSIDTIAKYVAVTYPGMPNTYDLLYIDVQGAELEVFKGGARLLKNARYIATEIGYGGGYKGDVDYIQLVGYLNAYGFKLTDLEINPMYTYGNAVFVKIGI